MAEGTIDLPVLGETKKLYVYIGAAVVVGIVGYAWFLRPAPVSESDESEDTSGSEGAYYDVGDVGYAPGWGSGAYQMPGGSTVDYSDPPEDPSTRPPVNNAEWTLRVTEALSGQGYDALLIAAAVGKYLARMTLSAKEAELIRFGLAAVGPPPQGDYPVNVERPGSGQQPPKDETPERLPAPGGFRVLGVERTSVVLGWHEVKGAAGYRVYHQYTSGNVGHSLDGWIRVGGLRPNTVYKFHVRTMNDAGSYGPATKSISVRTKR